jgi:hypothetical protein
MEEKSVIDAAQIELGSDLHHTFKIDGEVILVADSTVQRVPVASADPNDPLNFAKWRKVGLVVTTCWFCKYPEAVQWHAKSPFDY